MISETINARNGEIHNTLVSVWDEFPDTTGYALLSMGSLARMESAPFSDRDISILTATKYIDELKAEQIIREIHEKVERVSVIVRHADSSAEVFDEDPRSWMALLESRYIAGETEIFFNMKNELHAFARNNKQRITDTLFDQVANRHDQYGQAVALLEPNIKNSAGALRDIQALYYLSCIEMDASVVNKKNPPKFMDAIKIFGFKKKRENILRSALEFFLETRDAMHTIRGHLHDYLDFDLQRSVAERLGYGPRDQRDSVERFMRRYYLHAAEVHRALSFVFSGMQKHTEIQGDTAALEMRNNELIWTGSIAPDHVTIMKAFVRKCEQQCTISTSLLRDVDDLDMEDFSEAENASLFDRIMRHPAAAGKTLRLMNEYRVLGKVVPEFKYMEHFFQHNIYHFFTADEHTITAIEKCQNIQNERGYLSDLYRNLTDTSVLTYALLLHDIAKPIDVARHELIGADITRRVLLRYGRGDIVETVTFLVRHHLAMEQLAFRRNFHDQATLRPFCELVETQERLDNLLLLTVSDMSALNPSVLTDWKRALLLELHKEASALLSRSSENQPSDKRISRGTGHAADLTECIRRVQEGHPVCIEVTHEEYFSAVTVVCRDAPQILSSIAASILSVDAAVLDARVETLHGGIVLDSFRVVDIIGGARLNESQVYALQETVLAIWSGTLLAPEAYLRHRRKWRRKIGKQINHDILTRVDYVDHSSAEDIEQTIIDVYAPDSFGLLYKLTETISSHGLNIIFAKIATRVDGVVDSFYVTDGEGRPFVDTMRRQLLREDLLREIAILTNRD